MDALIERVLSADPTTGQSRNATLRVQPPEN
jgi:hypothetical protein